MGAKTSCFGLVFLVNILLTGGSVYVSDPNASTMLEFYATNQPCRDGNNLGNALTPDAYLQYTMETLQKKEKDSIRNVMQQSGAGRIHTVNPKMMEDLSRSCRGSDRFTSIGFIFPGTKWCGPGNTARSYNDLGEKSDVDRCCREHDHCPISLEPGQCRRGICNISPFTRSHCDCDTAFKKCLQELNDDVAKLVATLYFNVAQVTCFRDRRSCPQWMRNDLSYTWFCDEWKFVPVDTYVPPVIPPENATHNEIPNEGKRKPLENSKIDEGLRVLYQTDEGIEKIMDNPKSLTK